MPFLPRSGGDLYQAAVDGWYEEGQGWRYNMGLGFSMGTGHFTQVVWAGTTSVGCATAQGSQWTYVVCNYGPPGNMQGQFNQNVLPLGPSTSQPASTSKTTESLQTSQPAAAPAPAAAAPAAAAPAAAAPSSGDWLAQHNEKRRMHQDTPDLVADQALITEAQGCADGMVSSGVFQHCKSLYGENLYASGGSGGDLYQAAVDGWYEEGQVWRYGQGMGFSMGAGHFTQVTATPNKTKPCQFILNHTIPYHTTPHNTIASLEVFPPRWCGRAPPR